MNSLSDSQVKSLLQSCRRIAVVGLSPRPERPSYHVTEYLIEHGYEILGVNPGQKEILNRPCVGSLNELTGPVELIDVFRASDVVPAIVAEVLANQKRLGIKMLWLQEGVTHLQSEELARAAGISVVSDRCILKEHRRLGV